LNRRAPTFRAAFCTNPKLASNSTGVSLSIKAGPVSGAKRFLPIPLLMELILTSPKLRRQFLSLLKIFTQQNLLAIMQLRYGDGSAAPR
jgi:hypothetical protein